MLIGSRLDYEPDPEISPSIGLLWRRLIGKAVGVEADHRDRPLQHEAWPVLTLIMGLKVPIEATNHDVLGAE